MKNRVQVAAVLLAVVSLVAFALWRNELHVSSYKAFYCAGRAVVMFQNPYLVEPLRSCEHQLVESSHFPAYAVEPAPLAGYALALFTPLALLPPATSHLVYLALLIGALFVTGGAIARITGLSPALVVLSCLSAWTCSVWFGEIPPFYVAALALCGLALQRQRPWIAGLWACLAMIEPHLGVPLVLSLAINAPRTIPALLLGGAVLLSIDLAVSGPHVAYSYFTTYLPIQAGSEITAIDQFSLTHVLHLLGVPDKSALALGLLSYVVMTIAGIWIGRLLSRRLEMPALIAFTAPAFALLGGSYVHDIQMFAALPLILALISRVRPVPPLLAISAALLSITWTQAGSILSLFVAAISAFSMGLLIFEHTARSVSKAAVLSMVLTVALVLVNRLPKAQAPEIASGQPMISASAPAAQVWAELIKEDGFWSKPSPWSEGRKVPTWAGLGLLVVCWSGLLLIQTQGHVRDRRVDTGHV